MSVLANQNYPLSPISRASLTTTLEDRFISDSINIYSAFSVYDTGQGGQSGKGITFQQPYVWAGLNDSDAWKYIKRFDSRANPVGSNVQEAQRISEFAASGLGQAFANTQNLLQAQNAFNETRQWNPQSIQLETSVFGSILNHPQRHIENSGGIGLVTTILNGALTLIGSSAQSYSGKGPIPGTARLGLDALSLEVQENGGWAAKGLTRYATAVRARNRFIQKFQSNGQNIEGDTTVGTFLTSIGDSIISSVTSDILGTGAETADWDYRVEYSDTIDVYQGFRMDSSGLLQYEVNGTVYDVSDVNPYFASSTSPDTMANWYQGPANSGNNPFPSIIAIYATQAAGGTFDIGTFYDVTNQAWQPLGNPPDDTSLISLTSNTNPNPGSTPDGDPINKIIGPDNVNRIAAAVMLWNTSNSPTYGQIDNTFYTAGVKSYPQVIATHNQSSPNTLPTYLQSITDASSIIDTSAGKDFSSQYKADGYNSLNPISGVDGTIPGELLASSGNNSKDIIFFYFFDMINGVYIPFRATIIGLNENTGVEWEDFQYIGRADKLYMYKGFTREINFTFCVYASSVSEMEPMWNRINYLAGLARPANYTSNSTNSGLGQFIYPPMIKFRIGDLYVDQPAVIRNFGMTVPDDTTWETQRAGYSYKNGVITSTKNIAQLPMKVDINISLALIEKNRSQTQDYHYFGDPSIVFGSPVPVASAASTAAAAVASQNQQAALNSSVFGNPNNTLSSTPPATNTAVGTGTATNFGNNTNIDTVVPPGGIPPNTNDTSFAPMSIGPTP